MPSRPVAGPQPAATASVAAPHTSGREQTAPTETRRAAEANLALAAATIGLILLIAFVVPQPIWHGQPARPPAAPPAAPPVVPDWLGLALAAAYALAWALPFRPYVLALGRATHVSTRTLLALTAALATIALLIFPAFGSDLFIYVDYARLWAIYGEHPLLAAPISHPEDWAFQFIWIPHQPSPYGPVWALLTWPIARLAGTSVALNVAGYKLLALAGYLACCWLIWTWPGRQAVRARALVLFAWSPLVLFDTLGKAHNDVLLALTVLLTLRLGNWRGFGAAVAGGLVKATGLVVLAPLTLDLARRRAWRSLAAGLGIAAALTVAAYGAFWQGPATLLPILAQTSRVVWSPGSLLIATGMVPNQVVVRAVLVALWLLAIALIARNVRDLAVASALVLLATYLLLTTAVFAHYLVPVIALAAVSADRRLERLVIWLSLGALTTYAVELLSLGLGPDWIGSPAYQALGSAILLGPAALALAASTLRLRIKPAGQ